MTPLADLLPRLPGAVFTGDPGLSVSEVTHDSRRSGPGALFVAIRGLSTDGNAFVAAARKKGAVAVCSEAPPSSGIPCRLHDTGSGSGSLRLDSAISAICPLPPQRT